MLPFSRRAVLLELLDIDHVGYVREVRRFRSMRRLLLKHDDAALLKRDDAALLDQPPPLALLPAQSPARETSKFHDVDSDNAQTPARTPTLPKALRLSPCTSDAASHGSISKTPITTVFGNPVLLSKSAHE